MTDEQKISLIKEYLDISLDDIDLSIPYNRKLIIDNYFDEAYQLYSELKAEYEQYLFEKY